MVCGDAWTGGGIFAEGEYPLRSAPPVRDDWRPKRKPLRTAPRRQNIAPHSQTPCYPCQFPALRITSPLYHLYTFAVPSPYLL